MHKLYIYFDIRLIDYIYLLIKIQIGQDVRVKNTTFLLIEAWSWRSRNRVQGDGDGDDEDSQQKFW